jgi:hypothetical protein
MTMNWKECGREQLLLPEPNFLSPKYKCEMLPTTEMCLAVCIIVICLNEYRICELGTLAVTSSQSTLQRN